MVLEIQNQQYYQYPTASVEAQSSTPAKTIPIGQVSSDFNPVNSQVKVERTIEDIYKIASQATGLNYDNLKAMGLLSLVSGKSEEELVAMESADFNKLIEEIKNAINAIKEDIYGIDKKSNDELDLNLVLNYTRLLKGEVPKGWDSVESFRKAQKGIRYDKNGNPIGSTAESLSQRLKVMYGIDIKTLSKEELAQRLEDYFYDYFNEQKDLGKTDAELKNLQLTDFSKLLFNSTPEEYNMFRDAIEYLLANNRATGYRAIRDSFVKEEDKIKFDNETTEEQEMTWATKVGQDGVAPTKEDAQAIHLATSEYKDSKHLESGHISLQKRAKDFYTTETLAKLEQIKSKLNTNEVLTESEKELYIKDQAFRGFLNAENISVGTNKIISDEDRVKLAKMFNLDLANLSKTTDEKLYTEVMDEVSKYIEEHPETLAISTEDFSKIISNTSNPIIENNPAVTQPNKQEVATEEPTLGFNNKGKAPENSTRRRIEELYTTKPHRDIEQPSMSETRDFTSEPLKKVLARRNPKEIIAYVKAKIEKIPQVLSEDISAGIQKACLAILSRLNNSRIADLCKRIKNNDSKKLAMGEIKSATLLAKVDCNNAAVKDAKQKYLKELQENTV